MSILAKLLNFHFLRGFSLGDCLFQAGEFVDADVVAAEEGEHETFAAVAEEAADHVADFVLLGVLFEDAGGVEEGPALLPVVDVTL
jgi:hypothetical protein